MKNVVILLFSILLTACSNPNGEPKYGASGLPSNCRAYIQLSIDEYKAGNYSAEDTMDALERNCGLYGQLWDYDK